MDAPQAYTELLRRSRDANILSSCAGVLGWDERTYMPRRGAAHRGEQMALLARLTHEMTTAPVIGELLAVVEGTELTRDPDSETAANVRELRRAYDRAVKLPKALVEELARVTSQAQSVWQQARQDNKYADFEPWLARILKLKREEAAALGYKESPYDALLDEYEPGATASEITKTFAALRDELAPLVAAIAASPRKPKSEILHRSYPVERQKIFAQAAGAAVGFDFDAGRLDETTHPFCSGNGPGDCRITTRYNERHFNEAFFGVLHESGHGIYEQDLPAEHYGTPLGAAASLGIHESQSRLWEIQVGRSRPFWEHFLPRARQVFHDALRDVTLDDFYFAVNEVRPSFIRVEADEVTYNLHIILRFELEQELIRGGLQTGDVPAAWGERFTKMFGLTPADDRQGCLQDIHWSFGGFGYFPTYTLGNLYAAQFMEQARRDLGDLDAAASSAASRRGSTRRFTGTASATAPACCASA
jgi:carboxypeptidase Taq